jgi:adenylate cyclase
MGIEIERKFLVDLDAWRRARDDAGAPGIRYSQGYLCTEPERTVRVRIAGESAMLTIKGPTREASRSEFEYDIPVDDALEMLQLCIQPLIEKTRYRIDHDGHTWEVDEFGGPNEGLVVAEIELHSIDEPFERPAWVAAEVTNDRRYSNSNLVSKPFIDWQV